MIQISLKYVGHFRTFTLGHMLSTSFFSPIADFYARRKYKELFFQFFLMLVWDKWRNMIREDSYSLPQNWHCCSSACSIPESHFWAWLSGHSVHLLINITKKILLLFLIRIEIIVSNISNTPFILRAISLTLIAIWHTFNIAWFEWLRSFKHVF